MVRVTEAIFENGVFKPLEPVQLPEHQRVRVIFEQLPSSSTSSATARDDLLASMKRPIFSTGGKAPSRNELHNRD